jgi:hypothetical protein
MKSKSKDNEKKLQTRLVRVKRKSNFLKLPDETILMSLQEVVFLVRSGFHQYLVKKRLILD